MGMPMVIEMVGYLGPILALVSMRMPSVIKLRVINMVGSGIFAAYAWMIQSFFCFWQTASLPWTPNYSILKAGGAEWQRKRKKISTQC